MKYTLLHRLSNVPWPKCMDPKKSVLEFDSLEELNKELDTLVKTTAYTKYQFTVVNHPEPDDKLYTIIDTNSGLYWPTLMNPELVPCKYDSPERPNEVIALLKKHTTYKDMPLTVVMRLRKELE